MKNTYEKPKSEIFTINIDIIKTSNDTNDDPTEGDYDEADIW